MTREPFSFITCQLPCFLIECCKSHDWITRMKKEFLTWGSLSCKGSNWLSYKEWNQLHPNDNHSRSTWDSLHANIRPSLSEGTFRRSLLCILSKWLETWLTVLYLTDFWQSRWMRKMSVTVAVVEEQEVEGLLVLCYCSLCREDSF